MARYSLGSRVMDDAVLLATHSVFQDQETPRSNGYSNWNNISNFYIRLHNTGFLPYGDPHSWRRRHTINTGVSVI